jgi:hypothetical protein
MGLRVSSWFGAILDYRFPYITKFDWSDESSQWFYVSGHRPDNLYLFDYGLNCWFWTSETVYPNIYIIGKSPGWMYILEPYQLPVVWYYSYGDQNWIKRSDLMEVDPATER